MRSILIISILTLIVSCSQDKTSSKYLRWVGDSKFNPEIDTKEFQLCNSENAVKQYFHFDNGLSYKETKQGLRDIFKREYVPIPVKQSGWIRVRFIVNCKGETGRFRVICSDENYEEQAFDTRITNQLLNITKSLDGWMVQSKRGTPQDYYQYLIFKIKEGDITEIMP